MIKRIDLSGEGFTSLKFRAYIAAIQNRRSQEPTSMMPSTLFNLDFEPLDSFNSYYREKNTVLKQTSTSGPDSASDTNSDHGSGAAASRSSGNEGDNLQAMLST